MLQIGGAVTPTSAVESSISVIIAFISKHLPVVTVAIHTPAQRHSIIQSTYDVSDKGGVQSFALEDCMNLGVSVVTVEVVTKMSQPSKTMALWSHVWTGLTACVCVCGHHFRRYPLWPALHR